MQDAERGSAKYTDCSEFSNSFAGLTLGNGEASECTDGGLLSLCPLQLLLFMYRVYHCQSVECLG